MDFFEIKNHGPLVLKSNYFGSDLEDAGKFFVSVNAGAVRILWPRSRRTEVNDMRQAQYIILTRGLYKSQEGLEILFEDGGPSPYCLHLTEKSSDMLPGDPGESKWIVTLWMFRDNKPVKILDKPAHWRRRERLPCLEPLRP